MLKTCFKASIEATLIVFVLGGGVSMANACDLPAGWIGLMPQNPDTGSVAMVPIDLPVAIGEPFEIEIALCGESVERVSVDATMPAHKHGMNYKPDVTEIEAGSRYTADGLFFHMPGQWQITIDIYGGSGGERFMMDVPAK